MSESKTKKFESLEPGIRAFMIAGEEFYPPDAVNFTLSEQRHFYDAYCAQFRKTRPATVVANDFAAGGVPCRRYRKHGITKAPALLYLHGGGFVLGGLDSHDTASDVLYYRDTYRDDGGKFARPLRETEYSGLPPTFLPAACASLAHHGRLPETELLQRTA